MREIKSFDSFKKNNDGTMEYYITIPTTEDNEIIKCLHSLPAGKIFKVIAEDNDFSGEYVVHLMEEVLDTRFFNAEENLNKLQALGLSNKPINSFGLTFTKSQKHYIAMYIRNIKNSFKLKIIVKED